METLELLQFPAREKKEARSKTLVIDDGELPRRRMMMQAFFSHSSIGRGSGTI
jgi:hypothetical protein